MAASNSKAKYDKYKQNHTKEKNKIHKMEKYLQKNPNDVIKLKRIEELKTLIK